MDEQKRGSMSDGYLPPDHIDEDFEEEFDDYYTNEDSDEDGSDSAAKTNAPVYTE